MNVTPAKTGCAMSMNSTNALTDVLIISNEIFLFGLIADNFSRLRYPNSLKDLRLQLNTTAYLIVIRGYRDMILKLFTGCPEYYVGTSSLPHRFRDCLLWRNVRYSIMGYTPS